MGTVTMAAREVVREPVPRKTERRAGAGETESDREVASSACLMTDHSPSPTCVRMPTAAVATVSSAV